MTDSNNTLVLDASRRPPLGMDLLRMSAKIVVGGILLIFLTTCGISTIVAASSGGGRSAATPPVLLGEAGASKTIQEIRIEGPILTHEPGQSGPFSFGSGGVTYGYAVQKQLFDAAEDDSVHAVLLRVSTPGGTLTGSEAIHRGVLAVKEAGKPIVAYVDGISASGGVWSTAAADKIFADHGSIIGSVGIIAGGILQYDDPVALTGFLSGVETRGGIRLNLTTAGRGKDIGNPFRPMTDEERATLQAMADEFYERFLTHVETNRNMPRARVRDEFGASIFANGAAERNGYIDGTKTYREVAEFIAAEIEAGDDWRLVPPPKTDTNPFAQIFGSAGGVNAPRFDDQKAALQSHVCGELRSQVTVISTAHYTAMCGI
jgi:protease-4